MICLSSGRKASLTMVDLSGVSSPTYPVHTFLRSFTYYFRNVFIYVGWVSRPDIL